MMAKDPTIIKVEDRGNSSKIKNLKFQKKRKHGPQKKTTHEQKGNQF